MTLASLPTLVVEFSPTTQPTATPVWVDISAYVRSFNVRRGRNSELDEVQTGQASLTLDNRDRRFDPLHATGPYYGNLKPMRRLRISATWNGTTYPIFAGYVERWPQSWPSKNDAIISLPVVDGLATLATKKLNTVFPQQASGARVTAVLTQAGYVGGTTWVLGSDADSVLGTSTILGTVTFSKVAPGVATLQAADFTTNQTTALSHLQAVARSESGLLYADRDGDIAFLDRHYYLASPYNASAATFGDTGGADLLYTSVTLAEDIKLYNEVTSTRDGSTPQKAADGASILDYFSRTYDRSGLLFTADGDALDDARWWLSRYKDPQTRFERILIKPQRDPSTLWPVVLARELGHRVTIKRTPPGGGAVISQQCNIESIGFRAEPGYWQVEWSLSPTNVTTYWTLGTSALDTDTRLVY